MRRSSPVITLSGGKFENKLSRCWILSSNLARKAEVANCMVVRTDKIDDTPLSEYHLRRDFEQVVLRRGAVSLATTYRPTLTIAFEEKIPELRRLDGTLPLLSYSVPPSRKESGKPDVKLGQKTILLPVRSNLLSAIRADEYLASFPGLLQALNLFRGARGTCCFPLWRLFQSR
jgi:hypothetical protein